MTKHDTQQIVHPQLSTSTFNLESNDGQLLDEEEGSNEAVIVPTDVDLNSQTVQVTRPVQTEDFLLQRPLTTEKEILDLAFRPAALNLRVTCRIQRCRDGLDKLYPQYHLFIENLTTGEIQHVMTARKKRKSNTSYYTITGIYRENTSVPEGYVELGKVRANFLGTTFVTYSHGKNPMKKEMTIKKKDLPIREELGAVLYDPNILGFKGPRKMTILMHTLTRDGNRPEFRPVKESETLLSKYRDGYARDLLVLHNKSPQWNEETQSFVLNFNGRVTQASVKNFQIVHDNDLDYIVMQFGRVERDSFTMDYKYPMCLLQAFSIALTSFDAKLACE
ncbi:Tub family-domain-containing protein [Cokeromyces recurvatus]|uniref:Tub family-domain-containing protein n=1 Tax=Cokeromyces recurvatus TaxID=90255 RepID=UPI00221E6407|nr:Tub family-domain-containing protein [Cokeromyces recurvatus]KAI7897827.1 Tub family-domain-containing protein [Cokeromyces recurvatus]